MKQERTIIITSGAYLDPQLEAEFGRIPPAFLPLGGQRLYEHQYAFLKDYSARIILSVPEDYSIPESDKQTLRCLKIEIIPVPVGISLGNSLVYVINLAACVTGTIGVLHGDTLLNRIDPTVLDVISVSPSDSAYRWGQVFQVGNKLVNPGDFEDSIDSKDSNLIPEILSGWFSFADGFLFVKAITQQSGHFLNGIHAYNSERQLMTVEAGDWFDFGHADTYYQSRRRVTTQRAFNELEITKRLVIKSSQNSNKMNGEANWFKSLPSSLRIHTPALLGTEEVDGNSRYILEYMHLPTLAELFVFGELPRLSWDAIFNAANEVLDAFSQIPASSEIADEAHNIYGSKTLERLENYANLSGIDLSAPCRFNNAWLPSLERMTSIASDSIAAASPKHLTLIHGDFCFSNLLYDHRADLIRVIDPRGVDAKGNISIFGDRRYDIGKLYHSVIGRYDQIIAGKFSLVKNGPLDMNLTLPAENVFLEVEDSFRAQKFAGLSTDDASATAIGVLLFLSMLPLHADRPDRQMAFLANAMRLFLLMDNPNKKIK